MIEPLTAADFTVYIRNLGKNPRAMLARIHPYLALPDEVAAEGLITSFRQIFDELVADVERAAAAPDVLLRGLAIDLLCSRAFADNCRDLQRLLPSLEGEDYERGFIAWRALDDLSCHMAVRAQSRITIDAVATPHGVAIQPEVFRDERNRLAELRDAGERVQVWRRVSSLHQRMSFSPYWGVGEPITDSKLFGARYGVPEVNLSPEDSIVTGTLRPGTRFVLRPAPAVGDNPGGEPEIVVLFVGVVTDDTEGRHRLIRGWVGPAIGHRKHPIPKA